MLAGNYVLYVESEIVGILGQSTVFTAVAGPFSDKIANAGIHQEPFLASTLRAFDFRIATKSKAST